MSALMTNKVVVNKKSILISLALLAVLTSCGKSKEAKNPSPVTTTTKAVTPSSTGTQTTQTQSAQQAQSEAQSEVQSQPTTPSSNSIPATPAQSTRPNSTAQTSGVPVSPSSNQLDKNQNQNADNSLSDDSQSMNEDVANPITNDPLVPSKGQSDLNNDQDEILSPLPAAPAADEEGSDQSSVINPPLKLAEKNKASAKTVDFSRAAVRTGGSSGELFYTSAGMDGLMEEFKSYNLKVSKQQQTMNMNLSKNIIVAKLTKQKSSGQVVVNLTVDEFGKAKIYKLKGTATGDRYQLSEDVSRGRGDLDFEGGFLKCLDRDGGCENAYAKLKFSGAYARVIFRNSYSDMHFLVQNNVSNNSSFEMLKRYVHNTVQGTGGSQKIDALQVSSFEIVNGRAGMGALLTTMDKEMVGLSIPLVVKGATSQADVPVAKLSDLSKNYDLSSLGNSYNQKLSQQISSVKLINNNGLGQLKLQFIFSGSSGSASIWMHTSRVQKAELSISEVRAFENKVKFF